MIFDAPTRLNQAGLQCWGWHGKHIISSCKCLVSMNQVFPETHHDFLKPLDSLWSIYIECYAKCVYCIQNVYIMDVIRIYYRCIMDVYGIGWATCSSHVCQPSRPKPLQRHLQRRRPRRPGQVATAEISQSHVHSSYFNGKKTLLENRCKYFVTTKKRQETKWKYLDMNRFVYIIYKKACKH